MLGRLKRWRAERFAARHPFPDAAWAEARGRLPLLAALDDEEADGAGPARLAVPARQAAEPAPGARRVHPFDLPAQLALAAQACLLTLGWPDDDHAEAFANVHEVLILPDAFQRRVEEMDEFGVMHEYDDERAGETSYQGRWWWPSPT
jgi:MtfA peptidase